MRLVYEIATTGQDQLRSVLRGVEREAAASDKRQERQRTSTAKAGARERAGLMHGPGRREQMAAIRQTERAQLQATRQAERAQATANARIMREQAAARRVQQRQVDLAIRTEERARIRSERNLARARESLDRQRSRSLLKLHNESERAATRLSSGRRRFAGRISEGMARSVGGAAGTVATLGATAVGVAGGFASAEALRERASVQRRASALANASGDPSIKGQLADEAERVKGFSGTETLGAMQAFVGKTGDLDAARGAIQDLGKLALATDSEFESLGETAGNAFNVIADAIDDPAQRLAALKKVMAGWAGQGNIGAVELKDLAQFGGRLGASTRKFAGDPSDLLIKMGAMAQAAVRAGGASDASEATTGVARFAADLTKKPAQKALAAMDLDIFAGPGKKGSKEYQSKLKDPAQIIAMILEKTKGSLPANEDVVNAESGKVLGGFADLYNKAEQKKKGTGRQAVLNEFKRYENAAISGTAVEQQAASRLSDPDVQLKEAAKVFNDAVGRELAPVAVQLAHTFAELVPVAATAARMLGKFIHILTESPATGIGLLIGAAIVKDIATAGIGSLIKTAVTGAANAAASRGGGKLDQEGNFTPTGKLAAVGTGAAIGLTIASAIITAGVVNFEKGEQNMSTEGERLNAVRASTDVGFIREQVREQRKRVNKLKAPGVTEAVLGKGAQDFVDNTLGLDANKGVETKTAESTLAAMEKQLAAAEAQAAASDKLSKAADKLNAAAGKQPPGGDASRTAPIVSQSRG